MAAITKRYRSIIGLVVLVDRCCLAHFGADGVADGAGAGAGATDAAGPTCAAGVAVTEGVPTMVTGIIAAEGEQKLLID